MKTSVDDLIEISGKIRIPAYNGISTTSILKLAWSF
jgi:hypothetical protein